MQRLIVRLIDSQNPEALQASLRWLYSFVRPHRLAIAGLVGFSVCASALVVVREQGSAALEWGVRRPS